MPRSIQDGSVDHSSFITLSTSRDDKRINAQLLQALFLFLIGLFLVRRRRYTSIIRRLAVACLSKPSPQLESHTGSFVSVALFAPPAALHPWPITLYH